MTTSVSEAEHLVSLSRSTRTLLMVGHTFMFNAAVRKMKEYLENSQSHIRYLYARRTNLGPIRDDVNAIWDLAPHDISIFNYLLGSLPAWASAVGVEVRNSGRVDVGFIRVGYPNGTVGHIHVSWTDPKKVREVVAMCADTRIVFDDLNRKEPIRIIQSGDSLEGQNGKPFSATVEATEPLKNQCRHFIDYLIRGGQPLTGARQGADVVRVLDAICRSLQHRGARVKVEKNGS